MGADAQTGAELMALANKLRAYAAQTDNAHYISLFLATAQTLDARARQLSFDSLQTTNATGQPHLTG